MTDWNDRVPDIELNFLPDAAPAYRMEACGDGINADRNGNDFCFSQLTVYPGNRIRIHPAPGGGWAALLRPVSRSGDGR